MRITLESDYALRIVDSLARHSDVVDAKTLSSDTSVTLRFTLKILHKLVLGKFVKSYKGVGGGYKLLLSPSEITLRDIIELIDGPIFISRCLENQEMCSMIKDKSMCEYHHIFDHISFELSKKLGEITIADVIERKYKL